MRGIGHVQDGGAEALLVGDMAYVGVLARNVNLPGAGELQPRQAADVVLQLQ